MLDPLSFTSEEAQALVGTEMVQLLDVGSRTVSGDRCKIVSTHKVFSEEFEGLFEYRVGVQWIDREGNVSKVKQFSKLELQRLARPLQLREKAASVKQSVADAIDRKLGARNRQRKGRSI